MLVYLLEIALIDELKNGDWSLILSLWVAMSKYWQYQNWSNIFYVGAKVINAGQKRLKFFDFVSVY